jgi:hypothetical protein
MLPWIIGGTFLISSPMMRFRCLAGCLGVVSSPLRNAAVSMSSISQRGPEYYRGILSALTPCEPDDERHGEWSREQLLEMDTRFAMALEQAFELGLESRESARREVKLPASPGPRWAIPLCSAVRDGLLRSAAPIVRYFGVASPTSTTIGGLAQPEAMVEIEMIAVVE